MGTAEKFDLIIERTLAHEGGYVCDPRDPGGETNFGISKKSYPNLDIKNLTRDQAVEIYKKDFWVKSNIRLIPNVTLAGKVFDLAVNVGVKRAVEFLQRSLQRAGKSIMISGHCGPNTLSAIGEADPALVFAGLIREAYSHYDKLSQKMPQYRDGWMNRLFDF